MTNMYLQCSSYDIEICVYSGMAPGTFFCTDLLHMPRLPVGSTVISALDTGYFSVCGKNLKLLILCTVHD